MSGVLTRLRATRLWSRLRDARHLRRHRAQRRFLAGFIGRGDLVFDIGANVGHYTLVARSLGARVVAVEPQAELAAHLVRRFGRSGDVAVVNCAVGSASGRATLHKTAGLSEVASLRADAAERSRFARRHPFSLSETVEMMTLEDLIARHGRPDFCKIDVEGHEGEVLAGLRAPVASLSFEFNREYRDDTARCLAQLSALAPYRFNYALGEATELAEPAWLEAPAAEAALWSRPDPLLWGDLYARISPQDRPIRPL
jgi:FkbM family methyltransferase